MHESDMLVLWGTDFPYFNFIPTKPEIVQIDRRGEVLAAAAAWTWVFAGMFPSRRKLC